MEGRIFRSLTDCRHLSIPYEEYIPTFPNCGLVSLEDLQELCKQSDFVRPKRPIASHLIHEINMNTDITMQFDESLEKENSNQLLLLSIACSGSPAQENGISDMLFQSIETLDEGVPLDVPGELIDVIQPYICEYELLQSAAAYADNSSNNMTQSLLCNGAHTLKDDCADEIAGISAMRTSNLTRGQYDSSWAPLGHRICLIGDSVGEANKPNCNSLNLEDILSSRRSETSHQHTHLPVCGTSHTLESILPSSRRPFWRCNKLYWCRYFEIQNKRYHQHAFDHFWIKPWMVSFSFVYSEKKSLNISGSLPSPWIECSIGVWLALLYETQVQYIQSHHACMNIVSSRCTIESLTTHISWLESIL